MSIVLDTTVLAGSLDAESVPEEIKNDYEKRIKEFLKGAKK